MSFCRSERPSKGKGGLGSVLGGGGGEPNLPSDINPCNYKLVIKPVHCTDKVADVSYVADCITNKRSATVVRSRVWRPCTEEHG